MSCLALHLGRRRRATPLPSNGFGLHRRLHAADVRDALEAANGADWAGEGALEGEGAGTLEAKQLALKPEEGLRHQDAERAAAQAAVDDRRVHLHWRSTAAHNPQPQAEELICTFIAPQHFWLADAIYDTAESRVAADARREHLPM